MLAFVPDVPSFYDDLTAGEHIRFVRQANRMSADDDPSERLMALFGLDGHRDQLPSAYSRGMRQKLALVLAFARAPRLLLARRTVRAARPGRLRGVERAYRGSAQRRRGRAGQLPS